MTVTPLSSSDLYSLVAENLGPNASGQITAGLLDATLNAIIASYPNIVDGGSLSTSLGTITSGVWNATAIGVAYGGTGGALSPQAGAIAYSTPSKIALLAATTTANQLLLSGASAAPAWSTATYPPITVANQLLYSSSVNTVAGLATANNGLLVTSAAGVPSISTKAVLTTVVDVTTIAATAATGTINYDALTQNTLYFTSNASANWTLNIRGSSGATLDSTMAIGQSMALTHLVTQGGTAFFNSAVTIDGNAVTPKWLGGTAPSAGHINSIDCYEYTVIKTASATFTVLAGLTQYK